MRDEQVAVSTTGKRKKRRKEGSLTSPLTSRENGGYCLQKSCHLPGERKRREGDYNSFRPKRGSELYALPPREKKGSGGLTMKGASFFATLHRRGKREKNEENEDKGERNDFKQMKNEGRGGRTRMGWWLVAQP